MPNKKKQKKLEENENQDYIGYANFIFEQVRFQQEARDNWFGHYLSIVGVVSGFATVMLAAFSEKWNLKLIEICLGAIFLVTGVVGILFYFLFLTQRVNYKMHYRVLNELQEKFAKTYLKNPYTDYYPTTRTPFKKLRYGADFFASLIQRLLIALCATVGCVLLGLGLSYPYKIICLVSVVVGIVFLFGLTVLHRAYEKVI